MTPQSRARKHIKVLTENAVKNLKPDTIQHDAVVSGFAIRSTPGGRKTWVLRATYPGQKWQATRALGVYPEMGLADAREKATKWRGLIARGVDPKVAEADERKLLKAERHRRFAEEQATFRWYVENRYLPTRNGRRADTDAGEIHRMLFPAWGDRPIGSIQPCDVKELFSRLVAHAPYDASNAWRHGVNVMKRAVFDEVIEVSPFASLDKRMIFPRGSLAPRQRVLDQDEVAALWRAAGKSGPVVGPFYRLLLLLGVRLNELRLARWSEFDPRLRQLLRSNEPVDWGAVPDEAKVWVVPRERFKMDSEHRVSLPDAACEMLRNLPRLGDGLIFTSDGENAIWVGDKIKKALDTRMLRSMRALARLRGEHPASVELKRWVNHDLRRVIRTNLAALGVDDNVSEMVMGHSRTGLQRIYDQFSYEKQIRAALEAWSARLAEIVGAIPVLPTPPTNIVPIAVAQKRRARTEA